jgi:hypothetical protein
LAGAGCSAATAGAADALSDFANTPVKVGINPLAALPSRPLKKVLAPRALRLVLSPEFQPGVENARDSATSGGRETKTASL